MAHITIHITRDHINRGQRNSCVSCPIALAIDEQLKPWPSALVSSRNIHFGLHGQAYHIATPSKCRKFISQYDRTYDYSKRNEIQEFSFRIALKGDHDENR